MTIVQSRILSLISCILTSSINRFLVIILVVFFLQFKEPHGQNLRLIYSTLQKPIVGSVLVDKQTMTKINSNKRIN